jgi:signal transduction histidine kinase
MLGFFRPGSRLPYIVIFLVLAAATLATLADQARRTIRSYRESTDRVLATYANLAANNYAQRSSAELLNYAYLPALEILETAVREKGRLPEPAPLQVWTTDTTQVAIPLIGTAFLLQMDGAGATGTFHSTGDSLAPAIRSWLADTLAAQAKEPRRSDGSSETIVGAPDAPTRLFVYRKLSRPKPTDAERLIGFEATSAGLAEFLTYSFEIRALLSPAMTGDIRRDSLVTATISGPQGQVIFSSPHQHQSPFKASQPLGPGFGGLMANATLHPDIARELHWEGPASSQLPLLLVLFVLAIGLLVAAFVLVRREAELSRLRSDFVAAVSHELRTPLAQIRLFAETLRAGRVRSDAERNRSLEIIDEEARRLENLVKNVLHVARTERGAVQAAAAPNDLPSLIEDIVGRFEPLAQARGCSLRLDLDADVSAPVDADALEQIVTNLLDNAVKYGPNGQTIVVRLACENGDAQISVEDEGPGIAPNLRESIWKPFERTAAPANIAGTGIGLSVVRDWAERHGGRAWVEGSAGRGARFVVSFPGATKHASSATHDGSFKNPRKNPGEGRSFA